jgi:hypothetical protein
MNITHVVLDLKVHQVWDFSLGVALKSRQNLITAVKVIKNV